MAEEQSSLHIDTDWKKQAQEEKRRLAEQEKERTAPATAPPPGQAASAAATTAEARRGPASARGAAPRTAGGEPTLNLDLAKHQIDMLGVLDEKTRGNLTAEEQKMLDAALYETRMRYVSMASQLVS